MSVIAWTGREVSADERLCVGDVPIAAKKLFILEMESGRHVAGIVGGYNAGLELLRWFQEGGRNDFPSIQRTEIAGRLILFGRRRAFEFSSSPEPTIFKPPFAWGSGADVAIGAMEMKAQASVAVSTACKWNAWCGGRITTYDLFAFDTPPLSRLR